MNGETFRGKAFVVNDWYLTAYKPIYVDGEVQGILSVGVKEKDLDLLMEAISEIRIGETGFAYAVDRDGTFVLHPTRMGENLGNPGEVAYIFEQKKGTGFMKNDEGREMVLSFEYYEPFDMVVVANGFVLDFLGDITVTQIFSSVVSSLLMFASIFLILYFILRRFIIKPIQTMTVSFEELAGNEGDLTSRLDVLAEDEIGVLSMRFNDFMESLDVIISEVGRTTVAGARMSEELSASSEESTAALTEIRTNIGNMTERSRVLDEQMAVSRQGAEELASVSTQVREQTESQSSAINESSASIEEMSASIQSVARSMGEKMELTEHLGGLVGKGRSEMEVTSSLIRQVTDSTQVIMDMVQVINQIANQTNLLAMNAAIEAAHAGDQGRGFAVVADEIRKLAESTSSNAKEIGESLKGIVESIHSSEEASERTRDYFLEIVEGIGTVTDAMGEIKTAMNELSAGSTEITTALTDIISASETVRFSTDVIDQKVKLLDENLGGASKISAENRNGMDEIDVGVEEVFKAVQIVNEGSNSNAGNMKAIEDRIGQFKTSAGAGKETE